MATAPQEPSDTQAKSQREWKDFPWYEKAFVVVFAVLLLTLIAGGAYKGFQWITADAPPITEEMQRAIEKELRPNDWIRAKVDQREDGPFYAYVEYKPTVARISSIESDMIGAYKVLYTSELGFIVAEIRAYGDLYDSFGREFENPIFNTRLNRDQAARINWDNLHLVDPRKVLDHYWTHPAFR